ncbi:hypothetical protein [Risungbinella massiliensis]|uniref:hypothetical protein n=1 Tax=Risungbinella massiliensis TaxID=1329796 RepID=UPI0005CBB55E|nr:hypothetical protein [Risungbinella massiliensis]
MAEKIFVLKAIEALNKVDTFEEAVKVLEDLTRPKEFGKSVIPIYNQGLVIDILEFWLKKKEFEMNKANQEDLKTLYAALLDLSDNLS